ncbi:MAG: LTA synthase family protein [Deltaproteobacteria bacterium]|jgi:hypothetical protein|nr:LTA synthase family protein [Deltaproteobacteria bacterium]
MKNFLASPAPALSLALLAPVLFMWSRNWHMYTWTTLGLAFAVLLAMALLLYTVCRLVIFAARRTGATQAWLRIPGTLLICAAMAQLLVFFLDVPLRAFSPQTNHILAGIVLALAAAGICLRFSFLPVNTVLSVFIALSLGSGLFDVVKTSFEQGEIKDGNISITLKKKPNIYLFWQESYHDFETMESAYGIDTSKLRRYLAEKSFFVYDNVFSTGPNTLSAMYMALAMREFDIQSKGNQDYNQAVRNLIGGGEGNAVYRILKENGYHTKYAVGFPGLYYFTNQGKYLDETDVNFKKFSIASLLPLMDLHPALLENKKISSLLQKAFTRDKFVSPYWSGLLDNLARSIQLTIDEGLHSGKPFFMGFKAGADHSPNINYSYKKRDEWVGSGRYQGLVEKGDVILMTLVDGIIANDPNSIIILIGDHGTHRLRAIWSEVRQRGSFLELNDVLRAEGESLESLAHDIFGVMLAIRTPEGAKDISWGLPMSNINLFRHIFAWCNDDPGLLQDRVKQISNIGGFKLVEDGKIASP